MTKIFGQEVELETMRVEVVAINEGYAVTVSAVLNDDDTLYATTVARAKATFEEATEEMAIEGLKKVNAWMDANKEAV